MTTPVTLPQAGDPMTLSQELQNLLPLYPAGAHPPEYEDAALEILMNRSDPAASQDRERRPGRAGRGASPSPVARRGRGRGERGRPFNFNLPSRGRGRGVEHQADSVAPARAARNIPRPPGSNNNIRENNRNNNDHRGPRLNHPPVGGAPMRGPDPPQLNHPPPGNGLMRPPGGPPVDPPNPPNPVAPPPPPPGADWYFGPPNYTTSQGIPQQVTVIDNFRNFEVEVGASQRVETALTNMGLPYRIRGVNSNHHAVGAAIRSYAVAMALSTCAGHVVLDYYSSPRTGGIVSALNKGVLTPIRLEQFCPVVVAADINRGINNRYGQVSSVEEVWAKTILTVDVYEDAHNLRSFDEVSVATLIPTKGKRLAWIGFLFVDPMGCVNGEGAWIAQGEKVLFSPDTVNAMYPVHSRCSWIWKRNTPIEVANGTKIVWAIKRSWGFYHYILFENLGATSAIQRPMHLPTKFENKIITTRVTTPFDGLAPLWVIDKYLKLIGMKEKEHTICVKRSLWSDLRAFHNMGTYSQLTMAQLERQVRTTLLNDDEMKVISSRFDDMFEDYSASLTVAIFCHDVGRRVNRMQTVASMNDQYSEFNELRASIGKTPLEKPSWTQPVLIAVCSAFVIGRFYQWFRGNIPSFYGLASVQKQDAVNLLKELLNKLKVKDQSSQAGIRFPGGVLAKVLYPIGEEWIKEGEAGKFGWCQWGAPFVEEAFKGMTGGLLGAVGISPRGAHYAFGLFEFFQHVVLNPYQVPSFPALLWARMQALYMHCSIAGFSFKRRVGLHMIYNCRLSFWPKIALNLLLTKASDDQVFMAGMATVVMEMWIKASRPASVASVYNSFRDNFYVQDWESRLPWETEKSVTPFPQELALTPTQHKSFFAAKPLNRRFEVRKELLLPGWVPSFSGYYWFLPTQRPGYVPSRSDENMIAIVEARIMAEPPLDPNVQFQRWQELRGFLDIFPELPVIDREAHVEKWLDHMESSKRAKYLIYIRRYETSTPGEIEAALRTSKLQVKADELLLKEENDGIGMKPRAIINVNPLVQTRIGPEIFEATDRLKELWNPRQPFLVEINHMQFTFAYGGAATDHALSQWLHFTLTLVDAWHIIVSGDDMYVINHLRGIFLEGDASMFDQSQAAGPLFLEHAILRKLGVTNRTVLLSLEVCKSNYVGYSGNKEGGLLVTVDKHGECNRLTGHVDTSIGNSLVMALSTLHVILTCKTFVSEYKSQYSYLGLEMKLNFHPHYDCGTFLKGMWWRVLPFSIQGETFQYYWAPLPSRILKVGKSLRDPRSIYKNKDLKQAALWFLGDVAQGFSSFMEIPILGVFVRNFRHQAYGKRLQELEPETRYKTNSEGLAPKNFDGYEQLFNRYGISPEEIQDFENSYPVDPFHFIQHPLLDKVVKDYA